MPDEPSLSTLLMPLLESLNTQALRQTDLVVAILAAGVMQSRAALSMTVKAKDAADIFNEIRPLIYRRG